MQPALKLNETVDLPEQAGQVGWEAFQQPLVVERWANKSHIL
jgi:hypothetical protein